jgi:hypothetical protein
VPFDQEEWEMQGSTALARDLRQDRQKLHLMVSLEVLACTSDQQVYPISAMRLIYGELGDLIAVVGNAVAVLSLPPASRSYGPAGSYPMYATATTTPMGDRQGRRDSHQGAAGRRAEQAVSDALPICPSNRPRTTVNAAVVQRLSRLNDGFDAFS